MYSSSSGEKNKYCSVCEKLIKDEPIIRIGEKDLCEECWKLGHFYDSDTGNVIGDVLGGGIGFVIGFIVVTIDMLIITMAENIAIIADRTTEILIKLEDSVK